MVQALLTICSLFVLEVLLSVDNAAVLALMVRDLPPSDQPKALRYGIIGAFVMRGASLFCVSFLVHVALLEAIAGVYLVFLFIKHFFMEGGDDDGGEAAGDTRIYKGLRKLGINRLWATIILVEVMDMAFSSDNIFACAAITPNVVLILIGVFLGIVAMRFVAQGFTVLMQRFPSLERSAFIVIGLLGLKLFFMAVVDKITWAPGLKAFTQSDTFQYSFSGVMLLIFFLPLILTRKRQVYAVK